MENISFIDGSGITLQDCPVDTGIVSEVKKASIILDFQPYIYLIMGSNITGNESNVSITHQGK
jgi:hypothetical protein